mmetsp:Transcript_147658/g.258160  ORF Transcript_147658/g.258160 Transcript_147658/m.258160 type:complete len:367 (-) Transcript_147658:988-2088(-)
MSKVLSVVEKTDPVVTERKKEQSRDNRKIGQCPPAPPPKKSEIPQPEALIDRQFHVAVVPLAGGILRDCVAGLRFQNPFGGQQPLHSNRSSGMEAASGDSHLSAQSEAEAVGEPGGGVVEHAGRVHPLEECLCSLFVFRDDTLRVCASIFADPEERFVDVGYNLHHTLQRPIFTGQGLSGLQPKGLQVSLSLWASIDCDSSILQRLDDLRGLSSGDDVLVKQQGLHGIARCWVVRLGVNGNLLCLADVRSLVHEHVADSIGVPHHGDLGGPLDALHHRIGPSGDDQIDVVVHVHQAGHIVAALNQLVRMWAQEVRDFLVDELQETLIRMLGLASALQDQWVAGTDTQGHDLGQSIRPGLENDQNHP